MPDSLVLLYPCSRVFFQEATPSNFLSLSEYFIDTAYINEIGRIYKDIPSKNINHPIKSLALNEDFSFYLTPQEIVRKFPKVSLIVASRDPLRDECYKLADFLLSNNVDLDLKEFLYFPHGFMNLTSMVDRYYNLGLDHFIKCVQNGFDYK